MSIRLAYLVSQYPAITHTFILREIRTLRQQGFDIEVVSIRPPDRALGELSQEEREEADRTWAVLSRGFLSIFLTQLAVLGTRPAGYLRGLWLAIKLARLNFEAA